MATGIGGTDGVVHQQDRGSKTLCGLRLQSARDWSEVPRDPVRRCVTCWPTSPRG